MMFSLCSCCHQEFNDSELYDFDDLPFCKIHFELLNRANLIITETVITSPDRPDLSVALHEKQVSLIKRNILSYIKMNYIEKNNEILTKMDLYQIKKPT